MYTRWRCLHSSRSRGWWTSLLLAHAHELVLLLQSLEATMAELGRSVDELEGDLLQSIVRGLLQQSLAQGDHPLLHTDGAALDHQSILVHDTVVREATNWGDWLLSQIVVGGGTLGVAGLHDAVDLLVDLSTVMVTILTSTGHGVGHLGRMPGANASHLAQTTMGLARQASHAPTGGHTLGTPTLGHTNDVDHLVLREDGVH